MSDHNSSKKWMIAVRIIMILLGIIQLLVIGWGKYITTEVINGKADISVVKSTIQRMGEDISYIRSRLDSNSEHKKWGGK